ncbi:hypothetical protein ACFSKI_02570 [Pseudogracilibacillus auburnensis]|uniref:Uncharacterized protein n=1 Tax=Pseudogracilibacillus auburnensis TaxID=1494959 RepID=A0A2V3W420_9BACI|nr:hypothetical protein [Pseudogracilibacillus auburnensis]PXW87005.1 hypothetical protein DFR56_10673 [Pseudogracilibacillus auburnensis]
MGIQIGGLLGLYGGLFCGVLGWYFGRKKAAKQRGLDEVHEHIWQKAKSFSWYITIITIYFLFTLYVLGVTLHVPAVLGILMLVQMASWGFGGAVLTGLMFSGKEIDSNFIIGITVIVLSVLLFVILAIVSDSWLFLFGSIPFSVIGLYFIRQSKSKED